MKVQKKIDEKLFPSFLKILKYIQKMKNKFLKPPPD